MALISDGQRSLGMGYERKNNRNDGWSARRVACQVDRSDWTVGTSGQKRHGDPAQDTLDRQVFEKTAASQDAMRSA
ncbi:hypothetical protein TNCV_3848621 [Trichonephila clavipes]|uniref:Uncharacterized protein n=1 Tax=Trichonephila clavipes TaxID=2585209 RepID=A0A8X6V020_TRICX|nr:hypothetical protein TNCV_3848621 [Trichonephila clavipes]